MIHTSIYTGKAASTYTEGGSPHTHRPYYYCGLYLVLKKG
jgi:hypothetical protein